MPRPMPDRIPFPFTSSLQNGVPAMIDWPPSAIANLQDLPVASMPASDCMQKCRAVPTALHIVFARSHTNLTFWPSPNRLGY